MKDPRKFNLLWLFRRVSWCIKWNLYISTQSILAMTARDQTMGRLASLWLWINAYFCMFCNTLFEWQLASSGWIIRGSPRKRAKLGTLSLPYLTSTLWTPRDRAIERRTHKTRKYYPSPAIQDRDIVFDNILTIFSK